MEYSPEQPIKGKALDPEYLRLREEIFTGDSLRTIIDRFNLATNWAILAVDQAHAPSDPAVFIPIGKEIIGEIEGFLRESKALEGKTTPFCHLRIVQTNIAQRMENILSFEIARRMRTIQDIPSFSENVSLEELRGKLAVDLINSLMACEEGLAHPTYSKLLAEYEANKESLLREISHLG